MSVSLKFLFPYVVVPRQNTETYRIMDMLIPDQEYEFLGHVVDMSNRSEDNSRIPKKPFIEVEEMTQAQTVIDLDGISYIPEKNFYFCRAVQFKKIPQLETTRRNNAIISFLQALDPESFVIIKMSW